MIQTQPVTRTLRKSTPAIMAAIMAIGLLTSAPRGLAVTMTWTNGSALWTDPTAWTTNLASGQDATDPGFSNVTCIAGSVTNVTATCTGGNGIPATADTARFTNDTSYTVTINVSTNVGSVRFSNTTGVVTMDAGVNTLTSTGVFRIADSYATSTVVWAGGTLVAGVGAVPLLQIASSGTNNVGTLIVTNGTVAGGGSISVGTALGSVGKLVVSDSGVFTNAIGHIANNGWNFRLRTADSQLIITNGGRFFWPDLIRAQVGSLILVSGSTSSLSTTGATTSTLTIGDLEGPGCLLIVSNGAKAVSENGTISIGRNNGSSNTGIVVGAGSQLISRKGTSGAGAGITIGVGSAAHRDNDLIVYDGGYVYTDGAFFNISGTGTNCSFHMGGTGAMSTGVAVAVRMNSQAVSSSMVVSNALFTCAKMSVTGSLSNSVTVLAKGTLNVNAPAPSGGETNAVGVTAVSGALTVNAGTVNAVSGTNAIVVTVGGSGTLTGNSLIITNGGNLFADAVRINGANSIVFQSGTLSVGGMDVRPNANGSNVFVVGDGVGAAYYNMTANGDGYHGFSNGGVVFTNSASLRGSGTLTGTIKVLGTFVPGGLGTVGSIFSSNSISFGSSTVLEFDLGTSSDSVTINSTVGLGNSTLNVSNSGGFAAVNYVLFTHTNTVSAPSGTITVGTLPAGFTAVVSNDIPNAQVLLVVSAIGGGDPYTSWLTTYGLTPGGNGLGTADPDGDGMSNTNEFLAGFNPTNSAAYLHVITIAKSGSDMNVTYLGASGDSSGSPGPKTNVLESTTGTPPSYTNNWVDAGQTNVLSGGTGFGSTASFVVTNGATGAARYYRVRVLP